MLRTESYAIADGKIASNVSVSPPHDMAARDNLAAFVARTLDRAEGSNARATWIDLIDHGAGDGGGLEADHGSGIMRADDMAGAIADGVAEHARRHPEDAQRRVDGGLSNQCLMATEGFAAALSHAGVAYLAASPETMLAPGAPTTVASDIAAHADDPVAMARAVVRHTMGARYDAGEQGTFGPAAAFDVLDLAPQKIAAMTRAVTTLDAEIAHDGHNRSLRAAIREDARAIPGMTRFTREALPWHADRPAIALYDTLASDGRTSPTPCVLLHRRRRTPSVRWSSPTAKAAASRRSAAPIIPTAPARRCTSPSPRGRLTPGRRRSARPTTALLPRGRCRRRRPR